MARRKNAPPAQLAAEGHVPPVPPARYAYSPHLNPILRFDSSGRADSLLELIDEARRHPLGDTDAQQLVEAVGQHQPWLEWAEKREQDQTGGFSVDPVVLYLHERLSSMAIIRQALREDVQRDLFADSQQIYREAVQFYRHEVAWTNRLILGDSLQVMTSLSRREQLQGKVQMIYMDPPYGIRFASNFQPEVGRREVRDRDRDVTREPEMLQAYRDTWRLGIHSYLSYLRRRLSVARELLSMTGSIFIQIGEEHLHHVRLLMDEVFGGENFVSLITVQKFSMNEEKLIHAAEYLLWYGRDRNVMKVSPLYRMRALGSEEMSSFPYIRFSDGIIRNLTPDEQTRTEPLRDGRVFSIQPLVSAGDRQRLGVSFQFRGSTFSPGNGLSWKTTQEGMERLSQAERLSVSGSSLRYVRYLDDFPVIPMKNIWTDTATGGRPGERMYVVQTSTKIISRCLLMTTDPGDLVLDPTCGSGTTSYVAEQWGRRWIAIDISRVALAIVRQRLLTARFPHYRTRGKESASEDPSTDFVYRQVPYITLRSIAQNQDLDRVFARHQPLLDEVLAACNRALKSVTPEQQTYLRSRLAGKQRSEGRRAITEADRRRWDLPKDAFKHWTVPFDTDTAWPADLRQAVSAYRRAWQRRMDDVDRAIQEGAEQIELRDQPEVVRDVLRVSGPFTVESVRPPELGFGEEGPASERPGGDGDGQAASVDAEPGSSDPAAYLNHMAAALRADGVSFPNGTHRHFADLRPSGGAGAGLFHLEGRWEGDPDEDGLPIAVFFGPQHSPVTADMVKRMLRAGRWHSELIIAAFAFDPVLGTILQQEDPPRLHLVHVLPDASPSRVDRLKVSSKRQIFAVFGQPDIIIRQTADHENEWQVEFRGVDIFDPIENTVRSATADQVPAWFLDSDFDGRCFCATQAFFPDRGAWEALSAALRSRPGEDLFEAFSGTVSQPFPAGEHRRVAVKVIDPGGNEFMVVRWLPR